MKVRILENRNGETTPVEIYDVVYISPASKGDIHIIDENLKEYFFKADEIQYITDDAVFRAGLKGQVLCRDCVHRDKESNICKLTKRVKKPFEYCSDARKEKVYD